MESDPRLSTRTETDGSASLHRAPPSRAADCPVETGTTVVGLVAGETVVLAADRRASLGGRFVTNKQTEKIVRVHPTGATALSGALGHIQYFSDVLDVEARLYRDRRGTELSIPALATLASNVLRATPLQVVPLLGGVDADGSHLYSLDGAGGRLQDQYVAGGSGLQLAYGVLERQYSTELTPDEGRSVAAHAVGSAAARDTASGDGILLATITGSGIEFDEFDAVEAVV